MSFTWATTSDPLGGGKAIDAIAYNGAGTFVAVGDSGAIATSSDGASWTSRTSPFGSSAVLSVIYAGGQFVAAAQDKKVATSPDGITWTLRRNAGASMTNAVITYGAGLYIVFEDTNYVTSSDGISWSSSSALPAGAGGIGGAAYGAGLFVAGDSGAKFFTSPDGSTWTTHTTSETTAVHGIAFAAGLFVADRKSTRLNSSHHSISYTSRTSGTSDDFWAIDRKSVV